MTLTNILAFWVYLGVIRGMNILSQRFLQITDPLQLFVTQKLYTQKWCVTFQTSCVITHRSELHQRVPHDNLCGLEL